MPKPPHWSTNFLRHKIFQKSFRCLNRLTQPQRLLGTRTFKTLAVPKPPYGATNSLGTRSFLCLNHLTQPQRLLGTRSFKTLAVPKPPYGATNSLGTKSFLRPKPPSSAAKTLRRLNHLAGGLGTGKILKGLAPKSLWGSARWFKQRRKILCLSNLSFQKVV